MLAKFPKSIYSLTSRGNAYFGKGDLDAALKDYDELLKISPNYIRARQPIAASFSKNAAPSPTHAPTTAPPAWR